MRTRLDASKRAGYGPLHAVCPRADASRRGSTCLYRPASVCMPCARVCARLDVASRAHTDPFSVCTPCARVCTRLNVPHRASTGPFRSVRPVYVCVRVGTCLHVPVPARFGVYAFGRGSTCMYRPVSVCTPCTRVCMLLHRAPRACTCPFLGVRPVRVGVRVWTWHNVPVPARFEVYAQCTCMYGSGRGSKYPSGRFRCVHVWTWLHVPVTARFGMYAQCAWVCASGRGTTCLYQTVSVFVPNACVCTRLDVAPRACPADLGVYASGRRGTCL